MVGYVAGVDPHCSGRCLRHVTGGELFLGQLHCVSVELPEELLSREAMSSEELFTRE